MKKLILIISLGFLVVNINYCQIASIFKFGNVVYYKLDSLSDGRLKGTNLIFDKEISDRYFDLFLKYDSIQVIIDSSKYILYQKKRKAPHEYQEIAYYKIRHLKNKEIAIKLLKLKNINAKYIEAEASIVYNNNSGHDRHETVLLSLDDIEGVFLGSGKNGRSVILGSSIVGVIILIVLI